MFPDNLLIFFGHFLKCLGIEVGIEFRLFLFLLRVKYFIEGVLGDIQHDVAIGGRAVGVLGRYVDEIHIRDRLPGAREIYGGTTKIATLSANETRPYCPRHRR